MRTDPASGPAAHFRTSVHASPLFAEAMLVLTAQCDLGTVVDVGSGRGELLVRLHQLEPSLRLIGVDLAPRPPGLPAAVDWSSDIPEANSALLVANEWLDNVPVDAVTLTDDGLRIVLVEPETGEESLGGIPSDIDDEWLREWWPLREVGERAEVGHPRDSAWAHAVARLQGGVAVAVDYSHVRGARPPSGSLSGYRSGRQVPPVPDGSCDITSAVALDSCAAAGQQAGAEDTQLTNQRNAFRLLGLTGSRPTYSESRDHPRPYVEALARRSQLAELTARGGLGDFGWLIQSVAMRLPRELTQPR